VVDFVRHWTERPELPAKRLLGWLELAPRQYHRWQGRYGPANEHNGLVPRDHWLADGEKLAITAFAQTHPLEGYRRLAFMMLDAAVVAVSPSRVYRVLQGAGLRPSRWQKPTRKGTGFVQPLQPHEPWHIDFSYVNIGGTVYYLCSSWDGASRFIGHGELREAMKAAAAARVRQRAREQDPPARPRIISDNGPQFVAKEFKAFIRLWQTSPGFSSPHYPQSNGKLERWHRTLKEQAIRPQTPLNLAQARQIVAEFVNHDNPVRLHSAIGYVTPQDKLAGRAEPIRPARDAKRKAARERRQEQRAAQKQLEPLGDPAGNGT